MTIWKILFGDGISRGKKNEELNEIHEKENLNPEIEPEKLDPESKINAEEEDINSL